MKNENKHTPRPWHIGVRQPSSDKFIYGSNGEEIANCDRLTNFPDVNLANARLIAAAPEMLEALERAVNALKNCQSCDDEESNLPEWPCITQAKEAIRKAKGEA